MTSINYVEFIKAAKNAARDVLRTEKVNALLGFIANVNVKINNLKESLARAEKNLARSEYDFRIATHFESPDLADLTKSIEESRTSHAKYAENVAKEIADCEKKIEEYNTKIENWHNGTSKVDLDRMNEMAIKFVKDKVGSDFNAGAYKAATTEVDGDASDAS